MYICVLGGIILAKNKVIAGDYLNCSVLKISELISINSGFKKILELDQTTVGNYELITEEHRKSAVSGVSRGLVGGVLLGPVGLLAGLSAKNKGTHFVAIEFKDGKKSLLEIDDKIYKTLIQKMFKTANTPIIEKGSSHRADSNTGNYNTPSKKKGCLPIGCLAIMILSVIFTIMVNSTVTDEKNTAEPVIDATRFSKINSAELIKIMGEPESIEDYEWAIPSTQKSIVGKLYIYEKNKYEFVLFEDVVARLNAYSGVHWGYDESTFRFKTGKDVMESFGISETYRNMVRTDNTGYMERYKPVAEGIDEVEIYDIDKDTFGSIHITYNSDFYD